MASAGPYASLHLAPDRQPCQHPTAQFSTGRMPFLPPNQQALKQHQVKTSSDHRSEFPTVSYTTNEPAPPTTIITASVLMAPRPQNDIGPCPHKRHRASCYKVQQCRANVMYGHTTGFSEYIHWMIVLPQVDLNLCALL